MYKFDFYFYGTLEDTEYCNMLSMGQMTLVCYEVWLGPSNGIRSIDGPLVPH